MWSGAACRFLTQPTSMFTRFKKIYGIQAGGNAFERPDDLLKWVDLYDLTQKTMQQQLVVSSCPCTLLCLFWPLQAFLLISLVHGETAPTTIDRKMPFTLLQRMQVLNQNPIDKVSCNPAGVHQAGVRVGEELIFSHESLFHPMSEHCPLHLQSTPAISIASCEALSAAILMLPASSKGISTAHSLCSLC